MLQCEFLLSLSPVNNSLTPRQSFKAMPWSPPTNEDNIQTVDNCTPTIDLHVATKIL